MRTSNPYYALIGVLLASPLAAAGEPLSRNQTLTEPAAKSAAAPAGLTVNRPDNELVRDSAPRVAALRSAEIAKVDLQPFPRHAAPRSTVDLRRAVPRSHRALADSAVKLPANREGSLRINVIKQSLKAHSMTRDRGFTKKISIDQPIHVVPSEDRWRAMNKATIQ